MIQLTFNATEDKVWVDEGAVQTVRQFGSTTRIGLAGGIMLQVIEPLDDVLAALQAAKAERARTSNVTVINRSPETKDAS